MNRSRVRFGPTGSRHIDPESPVRPGSGRGIANVRQRLAARYGDSAMFAAKPLGDRYLVVISVPAEMPA